MWNVSYKCILSRYYNYKAEEFVCLAALISKIAGTISIKVISREFLRLGHSDDALWILTQLL